MKTFWTGFTILDAIKNIHNLWEEVKISRFIKVWKKLIPAFMDEFEEVKTSLMKVTADVVEIAREMELEVEPEEVTDKTLINEEWLRME